MFYCKAILAASLLVPALTFTATPARVSAAGFTSAFQPLATPQRLADTRVSGDMGAGTTVSIAVTGAAPLPASGGLVAAVLNVTVAGISGPGYWTVFPHESGLPTSSNINIDLATTFFGPSLAVPNLVTVPVGPSGIVDVYSQLGGNVVIDMLGYYAPTGSATAGRFQPLAAPSRILDTRTANVPVAAGATSTYAIPGAAGSSAVALNVTAIGLGGGYWQVFAAGTTPGQTSNLNSMYSGHISANQVIVPVNAAGEISIFSSGGGHLVIDLIGAYTGLTAPTSTDGLFVPLNTPTRFLDTRTALNPLGAGTRLLPGWNVEVGVASNPAIARNDVSAVVMNITATDTLADGYFSVTSAGSNNPAVKARNTSNLNVGRSAQTLANHVISPVSGRGFDLFAQNPAHVIADVSGFFIGAPVAAPFGTPTNTDPTPAFCAGFATQALTTASTGSKGPHVQAAQQRLLELGFWNAGGDGSFGWSTQQAVMAYQKWTHLSATGKIDEITAASLNWPNCRPTPGTGSGDLFEVDKGRQLGFFIRGGKTLWVVNISSGGGYYYEEDNKLTGERVTGTAITTNGDFKIYRIVDQPVYKGTLGTLYRPRFVVGGIAVHGASNVPNYPASHGCIRVSNPVMDLVWSADLLPLRSRVWIHD